MLPTHGKTRDNGSDTLNALAALMDRKLAEVIAVSKRMGTRDYQLIASELFGDGDAERLRRSGKQYAYANFVRSVLDPVKTLPATQL
jgi:hypothetical protein